MLRLDRRAPLLPGNRRTLPAQALERRSSRLELLSLARACMLLHCTSRRRWYVHATLNDTTCGAERHHDNRCIICVSTQLLMHARRNVCMVH